MAVDINVHYTDRTSDPSKQPFTLVPGEVNSSETSLVLSGQGAANYSASVNENFLHLLENFASATPPLHGTVGQLWYYTGGDRELRVLQSIGVNGQGQRVDNWVPVSNNISIGITPPTATNRLWYDTSSSLPSNHQLKIYNTFASQWQAVTKQWVVVSPSAPTNTSILWYNTAAVPRELYVYDVTLGNWQTVVSHNAAYLTGSVPDAVLTTSNIGGNAETASYAAAAGIAIKLQTGRTISLSGGATASGTFDGSANLNLNVTAMNASVLTSGTVPVGRLGDSGTRAAGYYLAGNNVWTVLPPVPDSYTKAESNVLLDQRALRDSITYVGMASNDPNLPYMRRASDNGVYYLQPRLGYTPAPAATTLAGYNIQDAYTKAQVNALIPAIPTFPGGMSGNGWTKLPNGLIFQWGQVGITMDSVVGVGFSVAFAAAPFHFSWSIQVTGYDGTIQASTGMKAFANLSTVGATIVNGENHVGTAFWFAIGF